MKELGVDTVIGLATVGGITQGPGSLVIPDQIIDYTWGREHTFYDGVDGNVQHADFTHPFCMSLHAMLVNAAAQTGLQPVTEGVYGATQGPRIETAAEIKRLEQDGCDIVGMTAMPEAILARELGLCYATLATVVNWAAGKSDELITQELIERYLGEGLKQMKAVLAALPVK
jgi:purine nucleoside phosphorylase